MLNKLKLHAKLVGTLQVIKQNAAYKREGNADHYTPENLERRKRLETHPEIVALVDSFWSVLDLLKDDQDRISKEGYISMHMKMQRAMVVEFDEVTARIEANEDWRNDVGAGQVTMDKEHFAKSIFQVADIWVDDINVSSYVSFLDRLLADVSSGLGMKGNRKFKKDAEISAETLRRASAEANSQSVCLEDNAVHTFEADNKDLKLPLSLSKGAPYSSREKTDSTKSTKSNQELECVDLEDGAESGDFHCHGSVPLSCAAESTSSASATEVAALMSSSENKNKSALDKALPSLSPDRQFSTSTSSSTVKPNKVGESGTPALAPTGGIGISHTASASKEESAPLAGGQGKVVEKRTETPAPSSAKPVYLSASPSTPSSHQPQPTQHKLTLELGPVASPKKAQRSGGILSQLSKTMSKKVPKNVSKTLSKTLSTRFRSPKGSSQGLSRQQDSQRSADTSAGHSGPKDRELAVRKRAQPESALTPTTDVTEDEGREEEVGVVAKAEAFVSSLVGAEAESNILVVNEALLAQIGTLDTSASKPTSASTSSSASESVSTPVSATAHAPVSTTAHAPAHMPVSAHAPTHVPVSATAHAPVPAHILAHVRERLRRANGVSIAAARNLVVPDDAGRDMLYTDAAIAVDIGRGLFRVHDTKTPSGKMGMREAERKATEGGGAAEGAVGTEGSESAVSRDERMAAVAAAATAAGDAAGAGAGAAAAAASADDTAAASAYGTATSGSGGGSSSSNGRNSSRGSGVSSAVASHSSHNNNNNDKDDNDTNNTTNNNNSTSERHHQQRTSGIGGATERMGLPTFTTMPVHYQVGAAALGGVAGGGVAGGGVAGGGSGRDRGRSRSPRKGSGRNFNSSSSSSESSGGSRRKERRQRFSQLYAGTSKVAPYVGHRTGGGASSGVAAGSSAGGQRSSSAHRLSGIHLSGAVVADRDRTKSPRLSGIHQQSTPGPAHGLRIQPHVSHLDRNSDRNIILDRNSAHNSRDQPRPAAPRVSGLPPVQLKRGPHPESLPWMASAAANRKREQNRSRNNSSGRQAVPKKGARGNRTFSFRSRKNRGGNSSSNSSSSNSNSASTSSSTSTSSSSRNDPDRGGLQSRGARRRMDQASQMIRQTGKTLSRKFGMPSGGNAVGVAHGGMPVSSALPAPQLGSGRRKQQKRNQMEAKTLSQKIRQSLGSYAPKR